MPGLAVLIVGSRKDSQTYVNMKKKKCDELGILSFGWYALRRPQEREGPTGLTRGWKRPCLSHINHLLSAHTDVSTPLRAASSPRRRRRRRCWLR